MAGFTRLTLVGDSRRVDVVVASDQPLAGLMPRFLDMAAVRVDRGPFTLVRPIGDSLDLAVDCEGNQVMDGEVLRIVPLTLTPAPPAVSDVTDLVAGVRADLPNSWNAQARSGVALLVVIASAMTAGFLVPWGSASARWPVGVLVTMIALLTVGSLVLGRFEHRWACTGLCGAAGGLAVPAGMAATSLAGRINTWSLAPSSVALLLCVVIGVGAGGGLRLRPAQVAAGVGGVLSVIALVLLIVGTSPDRVWGVIIVLSCVALGLVPAWALTVSGLSGLDDFAATGEQVDTHRAMESTATAHEVMSWTIVVVAVVAGFAGVWLGLSANRWAVGLAGLAAVVMALRTRVLALAMQVASLWIAALAIGVTLLSHLHSWVRIGALLLMAVVAAAAVVVPVPAHVRLRIRRVGDLVDKVAVAVSVPVLVGLFGVYGWLAGAFS